MKNEGNNIMNYYQKEKKMPYKNKEKYDISYRIEKTEQKFVNPKNKIYELSTNESFDKNKKRNNKILKYIIIILILIIILGIIGISLYIFLSKNDKTQNDNTNIDEQKGKNNANIEEKKIQNEEFQEYSFTATYRTKDGKNLKIFNPSRLGLKKGEYSIYETTEYSRLRRIDEIEEDNGLLNSTKDGFTTIKVNFTNPLTNLDFMFEGCEDLIDVNLSQINSSIDSMIYTFTNCKSL